MSEISYTLVGDYYLPNIILSDERDVNGDPVPLGRYGMLHKAYLKEHRPIFYSRLLLSERLYPLCREVDAAAANRLAIIGDREIAHEVILAELVYC
jgi:hypothetical protein